MNWLHTMLKPFFKNQSGEWIHRKFAEWQANPTTPAIRFEDVAYWIDPDEPILQDITFQVPAGDSYIILGGSGAGKSTILRLTLGLICPTRGRIWIDGFDISRMRETELIELRRHVGIVFQEGALFDSLTLEENVMFPLLERLRMPEPKARKIAREILALVDLDGHEDKLPAELSGGMKRRGGVARALVTRPAMLLYDEPTAGLDPITSRNIVDLIVKLRDLENVTSIIVTHDLDSAFRIARCRMARQGDTVVQEFLEVDDPRIKTQFMVLHQGRIVFTGSLGELLSSHEPYVQDFVGQFSNRVTLSTPSHGGP